MSEQNWKLFCEELNSAVFVPGETDWISGLHHNFINHSESVYNFAAYDKILNHPSWSPLLDSVRGLFVIGHPGAGKSCMAIFLMKRLMLQGHRFLYSSAFDPSTMYRWRNGVGEVRKTDNDMVANPAYLWIMDEAAHGPYAGSACRWILLCDPQRSNFSALERAFTTTSRCYHVYFPIPTVEEVRTVALQAGVGMDLPVPEGETVPTETARLQEIDRRINIVGRAPRHVCTNNFHVVTRLIDSAVACCDFKLHIFNSNWPHRVEDLRYKIFCENATSDLKHAPPSFVSDYVQRRYVAAWMANDLPGIRYFLSTINSISNLSVPYGAAFKIYAHSVLSGGGRFPMRVLHKKNQVQPIVRNCRARITLPGSQVKAVPNLIDFTTLDPADLQMYLKPTSDTISAVDSLVLNVHWLVFMRACYMFHITVDAHRGINADDLDVLLTNTLPYLRQRGIYTVYLVFVVPQYMYKSFTLQPYNGDISTANLNAIEQWVLSVDTRTSTNYAGLRLDHVMRMVHTLL